MKKTIYVVTCTEMGWDSLVGVFTSISQMCNTLELNDENIESKLTKLFENKNLVASDLDMLEKYAYVIYKEEIEFE